MSTMKQRPGSSLHTFIDFEASSLGDFSYPIEVAWNTLNGLIEEYLISPDKIESWIDWSPESEKVHGLSKSYLVKFGKPPSLVCLQMNQQLSGKIIYSDNPDYDSMWLSKLYVASKLGRSPFYLRDIDELLMGLLMPRFSHDQTLVKIATSKEAARKMIGGRHRAAMDVRYLLEVYNQVADLSL
jgi:hypothetical protein